jgi:hypothetical protein
MVGAELMFIYMKVQCAGKHKEVKFLSAKYLLENSLTIFKIKVSEEQILFGILIVIARGN